MQIFCVVRLIFFFFPELPGNQTELSLDQSMHSLSPSPNTKGQVLLLSTDLSLWRLATLSLLPHGLQGDIHNVNVPSCTAWRAPQALETRPTLWFACSLTEAPFREPAINYCLHTVVCTVTAAACCLHPKLGQRPSSRKELRHGTPQTSLVGMPSNEMHFPARDYHSPAPFLFHYPWHL